AVLADALPANVAVTERERPAAARKRFVARTTPAAKKAKQVKATATKRASGKKPTLKKSTPKSTAKQPKATPVRDLGDRFINRAALGYAPTNQTRRGRAARYSSGRHAPKSFIAPTRTVRTAPSLRGRRRRTGGSHPWSPVRERPVRRSRPPRSCRPGCRCSWT